MQTITTNQNTTNKLLLCAALMLVTLTLARHGYAQGLDGTKFDIYRINDDNTNIGSELLLNAGGIDKDWAIYNDNAFKLHIGTVLAANAFPGFLVEAASFDASNDEKRLWVNGRMALADHSAGTGIWYEGGTDDWFAGLNSDKSTFRIAVGNDANKFTVNTSGNGWLAGSLTIGADLIVSDNATFDNGLTVNGAAAFAETTFNGTTTFTSGLTANNTLTVNSGGASIHGNVSFANDLQVGGLGAFGTLTATGQGTFDNGQVYTASDGNIAQQYFEAANNHKLAVGIHDNGQAFLMNQSANTMALGVGNTENLWLLNNGNIGIGTDSPEQKLHVAGNMRVVEVEATDVEVRPSGWADFVFAPEYSLQPIEAVKQFIEANHHLPGVPSAAQVAEEGISVAEMQKTLLQKIEELTLYVIDLKEENQQLKTKVAQLEAGSQK